MLSTNKKLPIPKSFWGSMDSQDKIEFIEDLCKTQIFTCQFVKKDGSIRIINCRLGVKKYLKDAYHVRKNQEQYLVAFDLQLKMYRNISVNSLQWLRIKNRHLEINDEKSKSKS